jgi:hypothetical protein
MKPIVPEAEAAIIAAGLTFEQGDDKTLTAGDPLIGFAAEQDVAPGSVVAPGTKVTVRLGV